MKKNITKKNILEKYGNKQKKKGKNISSNLI